MILFFKGGRQGALERGGYRFYGFRNIKRIMVFRMRKNLDPKKRIPCMKAYKYKNDPCTMRMLRMGARLVPLRKTDFGIANIQNWLRGHSQDWLCISRINNVAVKSLW